MERIRRTWELMGFSWEVLRRDKQLLALPLLSALSCFAVLAVFALPLIGSELFGHGLDRLGGLHYVVVFAFLFANYFVVSFFNTALVSCAIRRLRGEEPTLREGLADAGSRLHAILGWALISATAGVILRMIEDRSRLLGRVVAGLLGMAFSLASFLVVPLLVAEDLGPLDALRESAALLKRSWAEQVVGNVSFGLLFFLLGLPALLLAILGVAAGVSTGFSAGGIGVIVLAVGVAIVYLVGLALVQSAMQAIFQAAVYLNAREGVVVPGLHR